jgi:hypothetical protein
VFAHRPGHLHSGLLILMLRPFWGQDHDLVHTGYTTLMTESYAVEVLVTTVIARVPG